MRLFLEVTMDKYELPVAVADSPAKLAAMVGSTSLSIRSSACHYRKGKRQRFISVDIEDDEQEIGKAGNK